MTTPVYHIPVLLKETIDALAIKPGGIYLDVTFGGGGHSRAILEKYPTVKVVGLDWDKDVVERGQAMVDEFDGRLELIWGSFAHLYKILKKHGITNFDGILADFGTSQFQIQNTDGLSFWGNTPLDMRLSNSHHVSTAAHIINYAKPEELRHIFWTYGEEPFTKQIVAAIVEQRKVKRFKTTGDLADLIGAIVFHKGKTHPATRVFQALRIVVNQELENIQSFLPAAIRALSKKGRLVCISFHSLEDRMVKDFYKSMECALEGAIVKPGLVVASEDEVAVNAACRSAKLRAFEKK
jgi:16S rRNA (cytosine1402-N4)-methyltransferase